MDLSKTYNLLRGQMRFSSSVLHRYKRSPGPAWDIPPMPVVLLCPPGIVTTASPGSRWLPAARKIVWSRCCRFAGTRSSDLRTAKAHSIIAASWPEGWCSAPSSGPENNSGTPGNRARERARGRVGVDLLQQVPAAIYSGFREVHTLNGPSQPNVEAPLTMGFPVPGIPFAHAPHRTSDELAFRRASTD